MVEFGYIESYIGSWTLYGVVLVPFGVMDVGINGIVIPLEKMESNYFV